MSKAAVMKELKKMGTAQNVKIYKRHGAQEPLFGVSFANLKKLVKQHKKDTALARQLWDTGNTDARTLAAMIANPDDLTAQEIDVWVKQVDYSVLAGYVGSVVGKTKYADSRMKRWTKSKQEYVRDTGFSMLSSRLKDAPDDVADEVCLEQLGFIESHIHTSPDRAKQAMNNAMIAIGVWKPALRKAVLQTAKRIGQVEVDHGETGCKTPFAVDYIARAVAHQKKKKKRAA